ncbi:MAG: hypothetical protein L0332_30850 [Chloroflexi bacterium]|nr:hypothetical protein [Chloroflexota bacterium]MCI0731099.1 hypothetical protein [Chloroflexota bacterium]
MGDQERYALAMTAAETMYMLMEAEYRVGQRDPDAMMRRLKDLSAYSLTHAEILEQREGVEMLAIAMFFGATSNPGYLRNQERLKLLSKETVDYQGRPENVEQEIATRRRAESQPKENDGKPNQLPLL